MAQALQRKTRGRRRNRSNSTSSPIHFYLCNPSMSNWHLQGGPEVALLSISLVCTALPPQSCLSILGCSGQGHAPWSRSLGTGRSSTSRWLTELVPHSPSPLDHWVFLQVVFYPNHCASITQCRESCLPHTTGWISPALEQRAAGDGANTGLWKGPWSSAPPALHSATIPDAALGSVSAAAGPGIKGL